jgi:hypothetical protein
LFVPYQALHKALGESADSSCTLGDNVLAGFRSILSLSYLSRFEPGSFERQRLAIRAFALAALAPLAGILNDLKMPGVGPKRSTNELYIFKLVIAPVRLLKSASIDPGSCLPADPAIRALRKVLSETYSEIHDVRGYTELLKRIHRISSKTLVPYQVLLEYLDIELVAEDTVIPKRQRTANSKGASPRLIYHRFLDYWVDYEDQTPSETGEDEATVFSGT